MGFPRDLLDAAWAIAGSKPAKSGYSSAGSVDCLLCALPSPDLKEHAQTGQM
jgi:hypothetical protein